ncbi:hypothetical protein AVEN_130657-1 [Araneus ventricosus]|uniref:Uncharacterized protein n=1 Tax=Araneus ventricosus TaxID=182803 RepID=A0A4Y2VIX6_ARAVE|nr:hypothetical protein AVEN_130657-1 [Araneus ventricosus]
MIQENLISNRSWKETDAGALNMQTSEKGMIPNFERMITELPKRTVQTSENDINSNDIKLQKEMMQTSERMMSTSERMIANFLERMITNFDK